MSRVLVVDDSAEAADASAVLLRLWGHDARTARDGESALRIARAWLPDVVLLDIGLPGLDGIQVAAALRREPGLRHCRVVAMSALYREGDAAQLATSGVVQQLHKPLDPAVLHSLVGSSAPGSPRARRP